MKKYYTWLLTALLIIGVAFQTAAAPELTFGRLTGNDDFSFHASGKEEGGVLVETNDETRELLGLFLGIKYRLGRWESDLKYGWGKNKDYNGAKQDFSLLRIATGYRLLERKRFSLIPYLGWLDLDLRSTQYSGAFVGLAAHYDLTARIGLDAACCRLTDPELIYGGQVYDDPGLREYQLQLAYQLSDRLNLNLGYRAYHYDGRFSRFSDDNNYINSELDGWTDFLSLTFTYKYHSIWGDKP